MGCKPQEYFVNWKEKGINTYRPWVYRECKDVVIVLFDHLPSQSVLCKENQSQFGPTVKFRGVKVRVVDLLEARKFDV